MTAKEHEQRVKAISERVQSLSRDGVPFRIYHGATNSTRIIRKDADRVVDTSCLNHVVSVDERNLSAIVEPNVAMDALVDILLPKGLVPKVVPEFPGITAGGSFSGTACESSSFREGFFDRTVDWVEIVLADGEVVKASPTEREDLFYGAAGALGTLGVVTLLSIRLMKSKPYVDLSYLTTTSVEDMLLKLRLAGEDSSTMFLDGILFNDKDGVVLQGRLADMDSIESRPVVRFSRPRDPWFYLHAHSKLGHEKPSDCVTCSLLSPSQRHTPNPSLREFIPLKDYLFRYDRGAFWMGAYGWDIIPLPFDQFGRKVLDSLYKTRTMYSIMHHSYQSQRFIVQDLAMPADNAKAFVEYCADQVRIWPLWFCPIAGGSKVPLHTAKSRPGADASLMNIGLWGLPHRVNGQAIYYGSRNFSSFVRLNREIEAKVRELGGLKWLYAHNYATEDEFWRNYDRERYDELRRRWRAEKLPTLWDKVGKKPGEHVWVQTNILRGIWHGWLGKDYLLKRK